LSIPLVRGWARTLGGKSYQALTTQPRSGGAFSVARLCKDAAGLSVPLAHVSGGLLTGKPALLRRMPRADSAEPAGALFSGAGA